MKAALSRQEYRVLVLLAHGLDSPSAALRLGIKPGTIKVHIASAYRKLGVVNRAQAFFVLGWLNPPEEGS